MPMKFLRCIIIVLGLIVRNHALSQVSTATDKIVIDSMTSLEMPNKLEEKCYQEDYPHPCFPKTTLMLIYKDQKHS